MIQDKFLFVTLQGGYHLSTMNVRLLSRNKVLECSCNENRFKSFKISNPVTSMIGWLLIFWPAVFNNYNIRSHKWIGIWHSDYKFQDSVNSPLYSLCLLLQWIAKNIATNMADVIDVNRTIKIACYNNIIQSAYPRLLILCNIVFLNNSMPHDSIQIANIRY